MRPPGERVEGDCAAEEERERREGCGEGDATGLRAAAPEACRALRRGLLLDGEPWYMKS